MNNRRFQYTVYLILSVFFLLFYFGISAGFGQIVPEPKWKCFLKYISIEGETNINNFQFYYSVPYSDSIPAIYGTPICRSDTDVVIYTIPVLAFKGENPMMLDDFHDLLNASEYPNIIVQIEKEVFRNIVMEKSPRLDLQLTLAGVTNRVSTHYLIRKRTSERILIEGNFSVRLEEYNLKPPRKFFGLVRVNDYLTIDYNIILFKVAQ